MKSLNSSNFKTKIFLSSSLIWLSMVSGIALGKSNNLQKALKSYAIVADFEEESSIRRVNDQVYWSYPFVDTNDDFKNHTTKFAINAHDIPPTIGSGLVVQHLNRGRELFLEGNYTEAAKIWRSASLNSTAKDLYFRRLSYFTALAYLEIINRENFRMENKEHLYHLAIAATLLSEALLENTDQYDPLIEQVMPKYFYYMALLYCRGGDLGKATIAAHQGVMLSQGHKNNRFHKHLRFLLATTLVQNRSYLEAAQQLDAVIREEADNETAIQGFEKLGDIYLDLNKHSLALEFYKHAESVALNPPGRLYAKLGETNFWLSNFNDATMYFDKALEDEALGSDKRVWIKVRLADIYLAQGDVDKAKASYFAIVQTQKNGHFKEIAKVRDFCLELASPDPNRSRTAAASDQLLARSDLKGFGKTNVQSLATSCYIAGLLRNTDSKEFTKRLDAFHKVKPNSVFMKQIQIVAIEIQKNKLEISLARRDYLAAIEYYETYSDLLFKKLSKEIRSKLFSAYVFKGDYAKAKEFLEVDYIATSEDYLLALDYLLSQKTQAAGLYGKIEVYFATRAFRADDLIASILRRITTYENSKFDLAWILSTFAFDINNYNDCRRLSAILASPRKKSTPLTEKLSVPLTDMLSGDFEVRSGTAQCIEDLAMVEFKTYQGKLPKLAEIYVSRGKSWWSIAKNQEIAWQIAEALPITMNDIRVELWKKLNLSASPQSLASKYAAHKLFLNKYHY